MYFYRSDSEPEAFFIEAFPVVRESDGMTTASSEAASFPLPLQERLEASDVFLGSRHWNGIPILQSGNHEAEREVYSNTNLQSEYETEACRRFIGCSEWQSECAKLCTHIVSRHIDKHVDNEERKHQKKWREVARSMKMLGPVCDRDILLPLLELPGPSL
jgi:hypothetical protein